MTGSILLEDRTSWQSNGEETNTRMYYVSNNILLLTSMCGEPKDKDKDKAEC